MLRVKKCLLLVHESSSSSLDEAVTGADIEFSQDDYKAHRELLRRVAQNLGIQVEEVRESSHALVDILMTTGPSRVPLLLNDTIMNPIKAL